MKKIFLRLICLFGVLLSVVLFSSINWGKNVPKLSSLGEEDFLYYEENECDGIRIYGTGKKFDMVVINGNADISDKKSLVIEMTFGSSGGEFSPIIFDKYGNFYQAFGKSTNDTFSSYNAKTLDGLTNAGETKIWQWGSLKGEGKAFFEVPFGAFCWRYQASDNYCLETGNKGSANVDTLLTKQANNSAMGFALINYTADNTAFDYTLNAIYLRDNDNRLVKVINGKNLTINENAIKSFGCDLTENICFTAKIYATKLTDDATFSIERSLGDPVTVANYGLLNGVKIANTETSQNEYTYFYFKGENKSFSTDNFVMRLANAGKNEGNVSMFFYDARKSNTYRSRVVNGSPFYLFDSEFNYIKQITPYNQWGWIKIPQNFNGYMVMPKTSFEWNTEALDYFAFVCQTPNAINIEVGESKFIGALDASKSNLETLILDGINYFSVNGNPLSKIEIKNLSSHSISFIKNYADTFEGSLIDGVNLTFTNGSLATFDIENASGKFIVTEISNTHYEKIDLDVKFGGVSPESITLVSNGQSVSSSVNGEVEIPANFVGELFVKVPEGEYNGLTFSADVGKLGVGRITVTNYSAEKAIGGNKIAGTIVFNPTETELTDINAQINLNGVTIARATTNNAIVSGSSLDYEFEGVFASVDMVTQNALVLELNESYCQFSKTEIYAEENTFDFELMPGFIKQKNYIFAQKGECLEFTVADSGSVIVFVTATELEAYLNDGYTELFYTASFVRGIDDVFVCLKKDFTANEAVTVENAQLVVVGGEKEYLAEKIAPVFVYGEEIPEKYHEDKITFACGPTVEITAGGRYFVDYVTGGTNEPQFENVLTVLVSDDGVNFSQYQIIDGLYEKMLRAYDGQFYYERETGRLYHFIVQDGNHFYGNSLWVSYTDNPDAKNWADIVWSTPKFVAPYTMCNNPTLLSNGKYAVSLHDPYARREVKTDCYVWIVDDLLFNNPVKYSIKTDLNSKPIAESHLVELADGTLWHISRTEGNGAYNEEAFLYPNANEFTECEKSELICNGATSILVKLVSGNLMYVYCADESRSNMTVALSTDEGKTWSKLLLDDRKWVSMPDYAYMPDGRIFIVYDHERASKAEIRYAIINEQDILVGNFISENSVKMGIVRKSEKHCEITKVFTEKLKNLHYTVGVTESDILNDLPNDITVGSDDKKLHALNGEWQLKDFTAGQVGEYKLIYTTTLPSNLHDHYHLLEFTVTVKAEELPEDPSVPPDGENDPKEPSAPKKKKGCGSVLIGNLTFGFMAILLVAVCIRRKKYEK